MQTAFVRQLQSDVLRQKDSKVTCDQSQVHSYFLWQRNLLKLLSNAGGLGHLSQTFMALSVFSPN